MNDALELALVLLACTTPILAIIGMIYYCVSRESRIKQRSKVTDEQSAATAREMAELRQRIEVLETIVTDKGYQLNQELRSIGRQGRG